MPVYKFDGPLRDSNDAKHGVENGSDSTVVRWDAACNSELKPASYPLNTEEDFFGTRSDSRVRQRNENTHVTSKTDNESHNSSNRLAIWSELASK